MEFKIEQKTEYQGNDYWRWYLWLSGPAKELDQVKYVEYRLHPTFPNPVRRIASRENNFTLRSAGWGEFLIYANIVRKDGDTIRLSHRLELRYPDGKKRNLEESTPVRRIFLSFSHEDSDLAKDFLGQATYRDYNLQIAAKSAEEGERSDIKSIQEDIRSAIERSFAVVCLIGPHSEKSRWVDWELQTAKKLGRKLIGVKLPRATTANVPKLLVEYDAPIVEWDFESIARTLDKLVPPQDSNQNQK